MDSEEESSDPLSVMSGSSAHLLPPLGLADMIPVQEDVPEGQKEAGPKEAEPEPAEAETAADAVAQPPAGPVLTLAATSSSSAPNLPRPQDVPAAMSKSFAVRPQAVPPLKRKELRQICMSYDDNGIIVCVGASWCVWSGLWDVGASKAKLGRPTISRCLACIPSF